MPKVVDHEERRRELAEAVWRIVRRDGIDHASVRAVAAESGWSSGSLRRYFPTQDSLLGFAMELTYRRFIARLEKIDTSVGNRELVRAFARSGRSGEVDEGRLPPPGVDEGALHPRSRPPGG
ncbi:TetR/AcrR family transcriptional regulator, partial [Lentzea sp. NPDC004782]|uniref:TetR/AcrR family transcriptional regulator n=1 Tax=Lentzea sp. NPDC004782 TaxID=3154458 RepID=UPI0033BB7310